MTTVLVTGATDGLGRALARELVQAGDTVSGRYFNGEREARAEDQAYDPAARRRLRELTEGYLGP